MLKVKLLLKKRACCGTLYKLYWAHFFRKELNMGKDLKGRELGTGLAQRKDGRYTARFVTRTGYRKQSYFDTLTQARNWLQDAQYNDKRKSIVAPFDMVAKDIVSSNAELAA